MVENFKSAIDEVVSRYKAQIKQGQTVDPNQLLHRLQGIRYTMNHVLKNQKDIEIVSTYLFNAITHDAE